jgi:hypothetical protein
LAKVEAYFHIGFILLLISHMLVMMDHRDRIFIDHEKLKNMKIQGLYKSQFALERGLPSFLKMFGFPFLLIYLT